MRAWTVLLAWLLPAGLAGQVVRPDLAIRVVKNPSWVSVHAISALPIEAHELTVVFEHPFQVPHHFHNREAITSFAEQAYARQRPVDDFVQWFMSEVRLVATNLSLADRVPPEFVTHDGFPTVVPAADFHLTKHMSASAAWGGNLRFSFRKLEYDCVMQDGEVRQTEDIRHATFECNLESVKAR